MTVPPPDLRLLPAFGAADELASASSLTVDGNGVALDSDNLSAFSDGWADGDASFLIGDEIVGLVSVGNRASASGDRRNIIILLFFAPFAVDLVVVLADDMMGEVGVDGRCVWYEGRRLP